MAFWDLLSFPLSRPFSLWSGRFKFSFIAANAGEAKKCMKTVANMSATSYATWQRPTFPLASIFDILWRLRHWGSSGLLRVFDYDSHCRTWACFTHLCLHPLHWLTLLTHVFHWALSLFIYSRYRSAPFVFMLLVTWIKISFVVSVLTISFARAVLGLIRLEPELPSAITHFLKYNLCQIESISEATNCTEHWISIPIQSKVPITRIISNER